MPLRVGIDLVKAATVQDALAEHGARYLDRVYTPAEQEQCGGDPLRLAARFAAKEATMKVLQPRADDALPWLAIEVVRNPDAAPAIALHGAAAALARQAGLTELALSFTHEDEYAAAVVVGT
ncbi:Holo-[acyl-carrier-protein] synthase [Baekduia alba]|uniref:holo-ACP synthase n=1 Tax=Baekduia alba TaxID=2997333 RepID=UPI0023412DC7|nr:holo-ACP synthase [Baekduia alba]WCB91431.1 Holo-[acyl-carrier-protein] synthase [Baekduia alba]